MVLQGFHDGLEHGEQMSLTSLARRVIDESSLPYRLNRNSDVNKGISMGHNVVNLSKKALAEISNLLSCAPEASSS